MHYRKQSITHAIHHMQSRQIAQTCLLNHTTELIYSCFILDCNVIAMCYANQQANYGNLCTDLHAPVKIVRIIYNIEILIFNRYDEEQYTIIYFQYFSEKMFSFNMQRSDLLVYYYVITFSPIQKYCLKTFFFYATAAVCSVKSIKFFTICIRIVYNSNNSSSS